MYVVVACQRYLGPNVNPAGASPGFGRGGGHEFFFQIWEFACRDATCCAWLR